eukprot:scaffold11981_cov288-Ochromonas_danica.AAC.1
MGGPEKLAVARAVWPRDVLVVHEVGVALFACTATPVEVDDTHAAVSHHVYVVGTKIAVHQVLVVQAVHNLSKPFVHVVRQTPPEVLTRHCLHRQHLPSINKLLVREEARRRLVKVVAQLMSFKAVGLGEFHDYLLAFSKTFHLLADVHLKDQLIFDLLVVHEGNFHVSATELARVRVHELVHLHLGGFGISKRLVVILQTSHAQLACL